MNKKLEELTFSKLVEDIDKKWGHTYEDVEEEDHILDAAVVAGWATGDVYRNLIILDELPLNDKAE